METTAAESKEERIIESLQNTDSSFSLTSSANQPTPVWLGASMAAAFTVDLISLISRRQLALSAADSRPRLCAPSFNFLF